MPRQVFALALALALALAAGCQIPDRTFDVDPDAGDDRQEILVTHATLDVPEGATGRFDVSLRYAPRTTVAVTISSSNGAALPVEPERLTFTPADYAAPQAVTVRPPVDPNDVSETSTITIAGAGAALPATVTATAIDGTVLDTWGWPMQFPGTTSLSGGAAVAYRINVGAVASLGSFHTYVPSGVGRFRMALYADNGGVPGTLVAQMPAAKVLVNGMNDGEITDGPLLTAPTYFLAIRFEQSAAIGYAAPGTTGTQCFRDVFYGSITESWSATYGGPGGTTCATNRLMNVAITTYHQ